MQVLYFSVYRYFCKHKFLLSVHSVEFQEYLLYFKYKFSIGCVVYEYFLSVFNLSFHHVNKILLLLLLCKMFSTLMHYNLLFFFLRILPSLSYIKMLPSAESGSFARIFSSSSLIALYFIF